jgi:hypothetical protein
VLEALRTLYDTLHLLEELETGKAPPGLRDATEK